jgi:putative protease
MSSRDLWGIYQISEFFKHNICSLKIEGRMKSSFYVALTCKVYRQLIDAYAAGRLDEQLLSKAAAELQSIPNRDYFSGSLETPADKDSVFGQLSGINTGTHQYLGMVMETTPQEIIVRLVEPLAVGDEIEIIPFQREPICWQVNHIFSMTGEPLESMRKDSIVRLPKPDESMRSHNITKLNVVRFTRSPVTVAS